MKKKPIFNNKAVTLLMRKYLKDKKNIKLRNRIVRLALPLIDAAISKQGMRRYRKNVVEDIRQECALKVIQAIPKFNAERGKAFGFLWATICNMSKSIAERQHRPSLSLSSDEDVQREAELSGHSLFQTPENQHILNTIVGELEIAFDRNKFRVPRLNLHKKACRYVRESVFSGDLFFNRAVIVKKLKALGMDKKEIQFYTQYPLVVIRESLLKAKENADALSYSKNSSAVSPIVDRGDI